MLPWLLVSEFMKRALKANVLCLVFKYKNKLSLCIYTMIGIWTLVPTALRMWCLSPLNMGHYKDMKGGFGRATADWLLLGSHIADTENGCFGVRRGTG